MSNPGVIILDQYSSANINRFAVEDNIGESIHIHLNNFRIDLTIDEFLALSEQISLSLLSLDFFADMHEFNLDPHFMKLIAQYVPNYVGYSVSSAKISDLNFLCRNKYGILKKTTIEHTPGYKHLISQRSDFNAYSQFNYLKLSNVDRIKQLYNSIKTNGYNSTYKLVDFSVQPNLIRDGQHRAAILASLFGLNFEVPILTIDFGKEAKLSQFNNASRLLLQKTIPLLKRRVRSILNKL